MIQCVECGELKEIEEYSKYRIHKCGTKGTCKKCIEEMTPTTRKCIKCGEVKNMSDFGVYERNKFGRNTMCEECYKSKMTNYNKENRDKITKVKKEYRERTKKHKAKIDKKYREANKEAIYLTRKMYREKNKEEIAHKKKMYYASDAGRAVKRRHEQKRVMQIRATDDGSITPATLDELYIEQSGKCYICRCDLTQLKRSKVHLDHIKPLSAGGKHVLENVAWACAACNIAKGGRYE